MSERKETDDAVEVPSPVVVTCLHDMLLKVQQPTYYLKGPIDTDAICTDDIVGVKWSYKDE